jgi:prevent-host-death family protein
MVRIQIMKLNKASSIGVRELKQQASEVIRRVREDSEAFYITYRGQVVAYLAPVETEQEQRAKASKVWADLEELAREIKDHWPSGVSAVDAVREQRREL